MLKRLLPLRFVFLIAVVVTFANSIAFLFIGIRSSYHGFASLIQPHEGDRPGLMFLESLDMFMVSVVFLVFGFGMVRIFTHYHTSGEQLPGWLQIKDFKELKILLWETILVTLVVVSVSVAIRQIEHPTWEVLIIPGMILLLSVSLFVMRKDDHGH
jgi:uncharacterized membrane protein YqhA